MGIGVQEMATPQLVLAELHACDHAERAASARRVELAAAWADLHSGIASQPYDKVVDSLIDEATGVAVAAIAEFAAVHGVSTNAGRQLIGDAVGLRDRLPRCWRQMTSLRLPAWKARLLAQAVASLGDEATSWVDAQAAVLGDRLGVRTIRRLVLLAQARFESETVKDPARQRWVRIGTGTDTADGRSWIDGCLDTPDALDLDAALQLIAGGLDADSDLDLRRAQALGVMARRMLGQPELPTETSGGPTATEPDAVVPVPGCQAAGGYQGTAPTMDGVAAEAPAPRSEDGLPGGGGGPAGEGGRCGGLSTAGPQRTGRAGRGPFARPMGRPVMIYLHLDAHQLANDCGGVTEVGSTGQLVSIEQIRAWFGAAGSITIRPVIDLNTSRNARGYQPTEVMREQIALRDRTCVFPHCNRVAHPVRQRRTGEYSHDADHITAYDSGGETSTDNLACLCRLHHLLKTHTGWRYDMIGPGEYLWRSPAGHQYLRTDNGTTMLNASGRRTRSIAA